MLWALHPPLERQRGPWVSHRSPPRPMAWDGSRQSSPGMLPALCFTPPLQCQLTTTSIPIMFLALVLFLFRSLFVFITILFYFLWLGPPYVPLFALSRRSLGLCPCLLLYSPRASFCLLFFLYCFFWLLISPDFFSLFLILSHFISFFTFCFAFPVFLLSLPLFCSLHITVLLFRFPTSCFSSNKFAFGAEPRQAIFLLSLNFNHSACWPNLCFIACTSAQHVPSYLCQPYRVGLVVGLGLR